MIPQYIPEEKQKEAAYGDSLSDRRALKNKALQAVAYVRALESRYDIRWVKDPEIPNTWRAVKTLKPEYANSQQ